MAESQEISMNQLWKTLNRISEVNKELREDLNTVVKLTEISSDVWSCSLQSNNRNLDCQPTSVFGVKRRRRRRNLFI